MFQFSRFAHYMHPFFKWIGFPIRKSADQFIFADPRGLSQLITSFIASESQGIPRVPFLTFFYYTAFCSVCMLFDSCPFIRYSIVWSVGIATSFSSCFVTFKTWQRLYCCFLFILLLPICQRTFTPVLTLRDRLCQYLTFGKVWVGMVENNGFEPLTPCVQGRCSSQLS